MLAILAGMAVVGLDSAVNIDFPPIAARFGLAIPQIQWVVVSYTLTSASLMLVFGRIGDLVGHRRLFRIGAAWSGVAFIVCAASPDFASLLVGRVLQGLGAGLLLSSGPALSTQVYPDRHRARALGLYTAGFAIAGAAGPIVGGALLARFDWSCVFWMRIPLALAAALGASAIPRRAQALPRSRIFDWRGALWLVLGLAALVLAIGAAGNGFAVTGPAALVAVLAAVQFKRTERDAAAPIIRLTLFRDCAFALLTLSSVLVNLAGFAVLLLVPFALALGGLEELSRGTLLAIAPAALALTAFLGGRAVARGSIWPLVGGSGALCLGLAICALSGGSLALLALGMTVAGGGQGLFQVAYLDRTTAALPLAERGVAGSLAMLTRSFGLVLGATVLMLMFRSMQSGSVGPDAFQHAFRATFLLASALTGVATLAWLICPPQPAPPSVASGATGAP